MIDGCCFHLRILAVSFCGVVDGHHQLYRHLGWRNNVLEYSQENSTSAFSYNQRRINNIFSDHVLCL